MLIDQKSICIKNNSDANTVLELGRAMSLKKERVTTLKKSFADSICLKTATPVLIQNSKKSFCLRRAEKNHLLKRLETHSMNSKIQRVYARPAIKNSRPFLKTNFVYIKRSISIGYDNSKVVTSLGRSKSLQGNPEKTTRIVKTIDTICYLQRSSTAITQSKSATIISKRSKGMHLASNVINSYCIDKRPPQLKNSSGGNLKSAKFVIQKNSFAELNFSFSDQQVVEAIGLPEGMCLANNKIKGTPTHASNYNVSLKLNDGSSFNVIIEVPNLIRKL